MALGDSYSSGEGNPPYEAGTDTPSNMCHRSNTASYASFIGAFNSPFKSVACSGAITDNLYNTDHFGNPAQLASFGQ